MKGDDLTWPPGWNEPKAAAPVVIISAARPDPARHPLEDLATGDRVQVNDRGRLLCGVAHRTDNGLTTTLTLTLSPCDGAGPDGGAE